MQNKTYKTISLFSGYLGLDIGVSKAIGEGELVGWSDIEPGPLALGSHHAPKARRLGDITKIDWEKYKDIEVMAGGFCCQSLSLAGFRAGLKAGTRSGLWLDYAKGIGIIRPSLVVAENVAGLLSGISVSKEDERMDALRSEALDKAGLCSCEIPDLELPDGFEAPDPHAGNLAAPGRRPARFPACGSGAVLARHVQAVRPPRVRGEGRHGAGG